TGIATVMHHADALGGRVKTGSDALRGDITVLGARDIGKDWGGAGIANGVGSGYEGQRRTEDRITWPSSKRQVRQVQRRRAVGHGKSMFDTHHSSKLPLELRGHRPHGEPFRAQYVRHSADFVIAQIDVCQWHIPETHSSMSSCVAQQPQAAPASSLDVQISLDLLVLFEGFFVVAMIADIEPIAVKGIAHDGPA